MGPRSGRAIGRSRSALAGLSLSYWAAYTVMRPLVAPYATELGGTASTTAVIVAVHSIIAFVAAVPVGQLTDRTDPRNVAISGAIGMLLAGGVLVGFPSLAALTLSQLILGVSSLMLWLSIQELMTKGPREDGASRSISAQHRHRQIANYTVFVSFGQLMGPAIGGYLAEAAGFPVPFVVYSVACAGLIVLAWLIPPLAAQGSRTSLAAPSTLPGSYRNAASLLRSRRSVRNALITSILSIYVNDLRVAFLPLVLQSVGISLSRAGLFLALAAGMTILSRPILPVLLRRLGVWPTTFLTLIPSLTLIAAVPATSNAWVIAALVAGHGFFSGLSQPLTLTMLAMVAPAKDLGLALGVRMSGHRLAQWVGPLALGGFALGATVPVAFAFAVLAAAPAGLWNVVRVKQDYSAGG